MFNLSFILLFFVLENLSNINTNKSLSKLSDQNQIIRGLITDVLAEVKLMRAEFFTNRSYVNINRESLFTKYDPEINCPLNTDLEIQKFKLF